MLTTMDPLRSLSLATILENGVGWAGVTVFGHSGDGWAKSGQAWATCLICQHKQRWLTLKSQEF